MADKALVIGISGPSSSGKTTLARLLQRVFSPDGSSSSSSKSLPLEKTFIIHEDDFYLPDDQIPYTTLRTGKRIQDWDTVHALDITSLSAALAHVRETGSLPSYLTSIQDLNQKTESGVDEGVVEELRRGVKERLERCSGGGSGRGGGRGGGRTLAFLEGILLYSPPENKGGEEGEGSHILRPVHRNIDIRLFLPAAYEDVKTRREARNGYVTMGPGQTQEPLLPQRSSTSVDAANAANAAQEGKTPEEGVKDSQPQTFWEDPPGYVDDIVWPHYVQDHSWLLLPEAESRRDMSTEELVKKVGRGTDVRTDAGVAVAPGQGSKPMAEILTWAVEEVLKSWGSVE